MPPSPSIERVSSPEAMGSTPDEGRPDFERKVPVMYSDERHPPRFWGTIVTVALLLLGIILIVVITLSARLRHAETAAVVQQLPVPVETAPSAAPPAASDSSSPRTTTRAAE